MALSKNDEQLLELLLKERRSGVKQHKPVHIQILQFSMVFLSLVLFIVVGSLGILSLTKPQSAAAANTYSETWSATNGIYSQDTAGNVQYKTGIPANNTSAGTGGSATVNANPPGMFTVTAWTVTGTVN